MMDDEVFALNWLDASKEHAGMVVKTTLWFNDKLDPELLHSSLSQLIQKPTWRKFAGRVRRNDWKELQIVTPRAFPDGYKLVDYQHVDCGHQKIEDHKELAGMPDDLGTSSTAHTWGNATGPIYVPANFDTTGRENADSYIRNGRPLLCLYVTTFQNGTIVSLIWLHSVCDMSGIVSLLRSWSRVLRGEISQQVSRHSAIPPVIQTLAAILPPDTARVGRAGGPVEVRRALDRLCRPAAEARGARRRRR
ncbi:hypothetical protein NLG97_g10208 [Lecanicillium saksenae]|uniref:Uncharacterized protein n=1 Tax=Lecanicillium saksenae TaxID=468837 RepID=A0ACC1QE10_9HYPO|nr:hypothetical protein NLG97_g10208 [Lecanicillium saksenae]